MWMFQPSEYPVYVVLEAAEYMIHVDGQQVCCCSSLPMALLLYATCFYVFNLAFLDNTFKTLLFLQKFAFQMHDPTRDCRVTRGYRACDVVMDRLSKNKAAGSRKRGKDTGSKTRPAAVSVQPRVELADTSVSCAADRPTCSNDLIAKTSSATVASAVAHTMRSKRARKIPERLCE